MPCGVSVTRVVHRIALPPSCPVSGNPRSGSTAEIAYRPKGLVLEVASLLLYVAGFVGGLEEVRSMEGMIERIAADCGRAVGVTVTVTADLQLWPDQGMVLSVIS
jgi:NADPH-dependent 7-cyano-7-deazaguanine reductase QueF